MNRRVVFKTVLLCTGVFLMLLSAAYLYILSNFELDTGKTQRIVTASADIKEGTVINSSMLKYKEIKTSSVTPNMLTDFSKVVGRKAANAIPTDEYIRNSELVQDVDWYKDNEKIILLPLEKNNYISYAIERGSYIDIKCWPENMANVPKTVLSKVLVNEILDENGLSIEKAFGSRKAYIVLVLDNEQRDRLYKALSQGKVIYELYCSKLQKPTKENFTY